MTDVTMRQLLEVGAHFGHQTRFWCPKMRPYIYGHRNKIHIINLEQTLTMFNEAMNYLSAIASKKGTIVFVGTKKQAGQIVREQAQRANCPYVYHRWLGGMLTNYSTIRKSIDRLKELDEMLNSGSIQGLSKKEAMRIEREHFRLNRNLAGMQDVGGIPDALFVIDVKHEAIAIKEAKRLGVAVVAVVDTNCDPDGIDYIIPANDDAISAIQLYCSSAADAIIAGRATAAPSGGFDELEFLTPATAEDDITMISVTGARAAVAPSRDRTRSETAVQKPAVGPVNPAESGASTGSKQSDSDETKDPA